MLMKNYSPIAVCGLPVDSHMFSVLPPYFENVDEELLSNSLRSCFFR
jgi:hypothetical protein